MGESGAGVNKQPGSWASTALNEIRSWGQRSRYKLPIPGKWDAGYLASPPSEMELLDSSIVATHFPHFWH